MLLWAIIGLVVVAVIWIIAVYNGLIGLKNRVEEAKSDIDVQTKRRYDLIPNLVETVKGYAKHEKNVFIDVTKARTQAMGAKGMANKAEAENMLTDALKSVFAIAENYPELKANENFSKLQDELTGTEDKIEASRRFYNGNVRDFNTRIQVFPNNIIANNLGFTKKELFEAQGAEKEAIKVDFNEKKK